VRIEVLYFEGCPNHQRLIEHLPGLLECEGIEAEVVLRNIHDDQHARRNRFLGSPTVRVHGRDVDPGAAGRQDYGLKCRIYHSRPG
jgi:hypothetical protein